MIYGLREVIKLFHDEQNNPNGNDGEEFLPIEIACGFLNLGKSTFDSINQWCEVNAFDETDNFLTKIGNAVNEKLNSGGDAVDQTSDDVLPNLEHDRRGRMDTKNTFNRVNDLRGQFSSLIYNLSKSVAKSILKSLDNVFANSFHMIWERGKSSIDAGKHLIERPIRQIKL